MHIAYVYDAIYPYILGGVERRVWELSQRLAKRGHEVHLYGMQWWDGEADIEREGVMIHGTCRPVPLYRGGKRTVSQAVRFGASVARPLVRERFDVIDCQQFPYTSALVAVLAARISRSPLVITWHEVWGDYWYEYLGAAGAAGKLAERLLCNLRRTACTNGDRHYPEYRSCRYNREHHQPCRILVPERGCR